MGTNRRLLILGATGFVGSRLARAASHQFEAWLGSRGQSSAHHALSLDITDAWGVRSALTRARPDVVVHLAALSDIDRCEREPQLAETINHQGTIHVADACAELGARLIYTSTDAVFDGTHGIYHEHDQPSPANVYGLSKARAERAVEARLASAAIVRISLVLGRSASGGGNSYLEKVEGNLKAGNPIISPDYEYRNPIDVETLCTLLVELADRPEATGIFHIGAVDKISRYDLARELAATMGHDPSLIVAQNAPVPGRAPRGRDDFLASTRLQQHCTTALPTCQQVISRACGDRG